MTSSSIVSIDFISTDNLIRIAHQIYAFVENTNITIISREVIIIADCIAFRYPRSEVRSTRVNVIESLFSTH